MTEPIIPMADEDLEQIKNNIQILYDNQSKKDEEIKELKERIYKLENP